MNFEDPNAKKVLILEGIVPKTCTLDDAAINLLLFTEVRNGNSPCWGCNSNRDECGGFEKETRPYPKEMPKVEPGHTPASMKAMLDYRESKDPKDLDNAIAAISAGGIEAQEKAGQQDLVNSAKLPRDIQDREVFDEWGFEFGEEVDDLFLEAEMPEGWEKVGSDHSMWSYIHDEQGRKRASVFYKAAFYDRSAFMRANHRLRVESDYDRFREENEVVWSLEDADGTVLYSTDPVTVPPSGDNGENFRERHDIKRAEQKKFQEWVDEHYPDYTDPAAYWEEEITPH